MDDVVAIAKGAAEYPVLAPFDPGEAYPEFPDLPAQAAPNTAFALVREALRLADLDAARYGTPGWNPLGRFVRPGQTVLLKPNFVRDHHPRDPDGLRYTVTHGSVIRAIAEYVVRALEGRGRLVLGDAPQTDSAFASIAAKTGVDKVAAQFVRRGVDFTLVDFRKEHWDEEDGVIVRRHALPGDPAGYVAFDLGEHSRFAGHRGEGRYYGAYYDDREVNAHHRAGRHEYLISGSAIQADVYVNIPKWKTHKKTGVTLNLKNLVGINGDKNWLPHHTEGHPGNGGDQFPGGSAIRTLERYAGRIARRAAVSVPIVGTHVLRATRRMGTRVAGDTETVVRSGNWHGNDTTWRMALDLNACLLWGLPGGVVRASGPTKTYLGFVDGIVAGDGAGPLNPDPVSAGLIAFGTSPAHVDAACAWLSGFDPGLIPVIREVYRDHLYRIGDGSWQDVRVVSNHAPWNARLRDIPLRDSLSFRPHFGWVGAIERTGS